MNDYLLNREPMPIVVQYGLIKTNHLKVVKCIIKGITLYNIYIVPSFRKVGYARNIVILYTIVGAFEIFRVKNL